MNRVIKWIGVAGCCMAVWACAQQDYWVEPMLDAGTMAFSMSGRMDNDGEDVGLFLDGRGGFFPVDYLETGLFGGFGFRGSDYRNLSLGIYGEYNFLLDYVIVPYAGASAGLAWFKDGFSDADGSYLEGQVWTGLRYYFIDYAAVGCEFALLFATKDVYNRYEDAADWVLRLKTSWYF